MHVKNNIQQLRSVAEDTDLLFLKELLDSPVVNSLVKVSTINAISKINFFIHTFTRNYLFKNHKKTIFIT